MGVNNKDAKRTQQGAPDMLKAQTEQGILSLLRLCYINLYVKNYCFFTLRQKRLRSTIACSTLST